MEQRTAPDTIPLNNYAWADQITNRMRAFYSRHGLDAMGEMLSLEELAREVFHTRARIVSTIPLEVALANTGATYLKTDEDRTKLRYPYWRIDLQTMPDGTQRRIYAIEVVGNQVAAEVFEVQAGEETWTRLGGDHGYFFQELVNEAVHIR